MQSYEALISRVDRAVFEEALAMQQGYLLDFSDRTFGDFFCTELGIDPDAAPGSRLFSAYGTSKAKRLRSFIAMAQPHLVARALRALWEYRENNVLGGSGPREDRLREVYFRVVGQFEGEDQMIDSTGIEAFEANETLQELVAAIRTRISRDALARENQRSHLVCQELEMVQGRLREYPEGMTCVPNVMRCNKKGPPKRAMLRQGLIKKSVMSRPCCTCGRSRTWPVP